MIETILTAALSFLATNMDDLLVLIALFAMAQTRRQATNVTLGQCLGLCVILAVSVAGGRAASLIPAKYMGLLGLIPIAMGVRAALTDKRGGDDDAPTHVPGLFGMALIALSDGGDNIGVYVPLFAGYDAARIAATCAVFLAMMLLTCLAARKIGALAGVRAAINTHRRVFIPAVLIGLGVYIILRNIL